MTRAGRAGSAAGFVVAFGLVSLFADATYEGARSIAGPYLAILGAGAAAVSIVSGAGELLGYALRLVAGYASDRLRTPWPLAFIGYGLNLLAVPCLALAGRWEAAAVLLILERVGRGLRTPVRDAMLSHAAGQMGAGRAFGIHEALDQAGAVAGPLAVAAVLAITASHRLSFALLLFPAAASLGALAWTRRRYPHPRALEVETPRVDRALPRRFWLYLAGVSLLAAGYADFPLIAFHFRDRSLMGASAIPVVYALAMGVDALAALILGPLFDRLGVRIVALAALAASASVPLVFLGGTAAAVVAGALLWGVGLAAQESILKAAVVGMTAAHRRGFVFGLFDAVFGVFWFLGSVALGFLYEWSIPALVLFGTALQVAAAAVFLAVGLREGRSQLTPRTG